MPSRLATLALGLALLLAAPPAHAADPPGAQCKGAEPYAGDSLYQGPVDLPGAEFVLGQRFDDATVGRLEHALADAIKATGAQVLSAAVATEVGSWERTRNADGTPSTLKLYWASVGKAVTATAVLQLVAEGKLGLDDPIARWMPDVPNARSITIDMLLEHTSGLFSANEDSLARLAPRYRSPEEEIAIAARHGLLFCPGSHWRYSNTGYTILGRILERIDGRPFHESVRARIFARLDSTGLRALAPREEPADVAPLHRTRETDPEMVPNWGCAAGNVVGSADDMMRFWHALLTGRLGDPAPRFSRLYPMFDPGTYYGRGVMLYVLPGPAAGGRTWLGHSGGAPGVKAVVAWSPADRAFVAVALTGDGSAEATAYLLLRQLATPR